MTRTNRGLDIIRTEESTVHGSKVILTRKTTKGGNIRHGVVLEDRRGRHNRVGTFDGLASAWKVYKALAKV